MILVDEETDTELPGAAPSCPPLESSSPCKMTIEPTILPVAADDSISDRSDTPCDLQIDEGLTDTEDEENNVTVKTEVEEEGIEEYLNRSDTAVIYPQELNKNGKSLITNQT